MIKNFADDTVLILTGVQCVGKTTAAYNILKNYPEFRRVEELDIIRSIIRKTVETFSVDWSINKEEITERYKALFKSLALSDLKTSQNQSVLLIPYIMEIILRQQRRKIPTIIEGSSIIPSTYFPNGKALDWLNKSIIFFDLYISDEKIHSIRRFQRCRERKYDENFNNAEEKVNKIRKDKIEYLHEEALKLSQIHPNVFSIDTTFLSEDEVAQEIMLSIKDYFSSSGHFS